MFQRHLGGRTDRTLRGYLPWLPSGTWSHLPPPASRWSLLERVRRASATTPMGTGCADSNQNSIELLVNSACPDSLFFLKKKKNFFNLLFLFLAVLDLHCCPQAFFRLLIVEASLAMGHKLGSMQASVLTVHRLSTCGARTQ